MKKIICMMFLVLMMLPMACGEKEEFTGIAEGMRYAETYQITSTSKEGVFYIDDANMVRFRPAGKEEDMLICYDPNCIHEPASSANPDPTCRAALFPDASVWVTYYEGNIYYFVSEDLYSHKLYKMPVNGAGRTLIAEIPYFNNSKQTIAFYNDKMYYIIADMEKNDSTGIIERRCYIMEYDLLSGDYRLVTEEITDMFLGMDVTEDYLYLLLTNEEGDVYRAKYNKTTGEGEIFISPEEYKTHRSLKVYDDYYIFTNGKDKLGIKYFDSGKEEVLVDEDIEGDDYITAVASGNGIFYRIMDVTDNGETIETAAGYFYNILENETVDITTKTLELDIRDYDGYQGYFICNVLKDTMVVSEEEILSTGKAVKK